VAPTRKTARPREKVIRGMQEHFGLGRLAVSTRQRFEAAVRVSGIESLWRQVTQMSDAFRKLMLASFAISVSCLPVRADQMPFEGAWAPVSSNFPGSEVKACAAVAKFGLARLSGNADDVEIIAFTSTKRLDFGGYADDESSYISMTRDSGGGYIFRDRWYDDGEGGGRARLKTKTYAVRMIDPLNLEITEGKVRTRYVKCVPSTAVHASTAARPRSDQGPGPVRPPQVAEAATPVAAEAKSPQISEAPRVPAPPASAPSAPNAELSVQSQEPVNTTKFRGIFIGMTRRDIAKFTSNEFVANIENANPKANPCNGSHEESCKVANAMGLFDQHNKATFNLKGSKKVCAEAIFGKDERVEELTFDKCFFGASDLEFDPFVQAIVGNYGVSGVSCRSDLDRPLSRQYALEGVGPSNPRICTGLAKTGEKITITTGGILYSDMTVEKATGKPTFD
jgi:hypothetical protein